MLKKYSEKYGKTQNQIILNWMNSLGFKPEVFSKSEQHIKENWEAMEFKMMQEEYDSLTDFRIPDYIPRQINWNNIGNGESIMPSVINFDEDYKKSKR